MVTRRKLLKTFLVLASSNLFNHSVKANLVNHSIIKAEKKCCFEQFQWLSQVLTKQNELDQQIARKIYQLIINEPYGVENLNRIFIRLIGLSGDQKTIVLDSSDYSDDEQWFISHLILTWYTGVYFHTRGNFLVTFKGALMYQFKSQFRLPPTYCPGKPGFWSVPPKITN